MRYSLLLAIAAFAVFAPKLASAEVMFTVACEDYYPEVESPLSTTIIAEVGRDASGTFTGLRCRAVEGDPVDTCKINDGGCCACNVARGFTPECSVTVEYGEATTAAHCLAMYPPCYYGNGCQTPTAAVLAADQKPATIRRNRKKLRLKHRLVR